MSSSKSFGGSNRGGHTQKGGFGSAVTSNKSGQGTQKGGSTPQKGGSTPQKGGSTPQKGGSAPQKSGGGGGGGSGISGGGHVTHSGFNQRGGSSSWRGSPAQKPTRGNHTESPIQRSSAVEGSRRVTGPMHGKAVVCYVANWAPYRTGGGSFTIEDIEPSLCTHLVYAFAALDENTLSIKSHDPWQDLEKDGGKAGYKRAVALKQRYPHLKVTIAIGGWNEGSPKYSRMASSFETRAQFIKSVIDFLGTHKFDGLDLDWEYPTKREGRPQDKLNFVALVKELKEAFRPHKYILTAAVGAGKDTMDAAYDFPQLSKHLDLIHMMCYDYHGTWDRVVGANAPLRGLSPDDVLNVEFTIKYMLSHGVSPYKLVLGLPMYGRTFLLEKPEAPRVEFGESRVHSQGFPGPLTKENGFMGYNEICMELSNGTGWQYHWHNLTGTPYLRNDDKVISYDNARSIALKVKMAVDYGLGGLMVWSMDTDDFRGYNRGEPDAYTDIQARYQQLSEDPRLRKALNNLQLPDANRIGVRSFYSVANSRLQLRLPSAHFTNYNLMRTIDEATTLALEEKRIVDEMNRITKQNEINRDDGQGKTGKGRAYGLGSSFLTMLACIFVVLSMF